MTKQSNNNLAQIHHFDLYGKRDDKYEFLRENSLDTIEWNELENKDPSFFFVPKDFAVQETYDVGFSVKSIFPLFSSGISTHRDPFVVDVAKEKLSARLEEFFDQSLTDVEIGTKLKLKDNRDWSLSEHTFVTLSVYFFVI